MDDPVYPIYRVEVRWEQDGEHDENYPSRHQGLPKGRIWNGSSFYRMYREDPGGDKVLSDIQEWWDGYKENKLDGKGPGDPEITVAEPFHETWCLSWFEHWTFDDGRSDEEFLASFERYVRRYEHLQTYSVDIPDGYRCLMGAQDRWRWKARPAPRDESPPPCRCEHCRAQGKVRIGH